MSFESELEDKLKRQHKEEDKCPFCNGEIKEYRMFKYGNDSIRSYKTAECKQCGAVELLTKKDGLVWYRKEELEKVCDELGIEFNDE